MGRLTGEYDFASDDFVGNGQKSIFEPKCHGVKYWDHHKDSGIVWGVYDPSVSDDVLKQRYRQYYLGVGREFTRKPFIQRTKTRTLITQIFGLDI